MARFELREKALALREQGLSLNEIVQKLRANKSTVSYWCRDIKLSKLQQEKLYARSSIKSLGALLRASEQKRSARIAKVKELTAEGKGAVGKLSSRDRYIAGLALYWSEGYKHKGEEIGFTNSDPRMIVFFIRWIADFYNIDKGRLILRVSINKAHAYRIKQVESYWSKVTGVPFTQFTKTSLIKSLSKKEYANHSTHYGTLRVKVRRGTDLRRKILGSIEQLKVGR
ncbi:hypothetical protein IT396_01995 [Candidatus Nomurabacteria bacterium]|nr:hypothetical protein [Candidatus Nomurabacteria bacterium]